MNVRTMFDIKIVDGGAVVYSGKLVGTPREIAQMCAGSYDGWLRMVGSETGEGFMVGPGFRGIIAIAPVEVAPVEVAPETT